MKQSSKSKKPNNGRLKGGFGNSTQKIQRPVHGEITKNARRGWSTHNRVPIAHILDGPRMSGRYVRRREEQKAKAAEDLIKAAESRVATFREARESRHEEEQSTDSIREEFRREWETKVASLNLAETLECFGVAVEGGAHANAKQLRSAYRKALLRFHPDRQGAKELRERVAAEERFKILSQKMEQG